MSIHYLALSRKPFSKIKTGKKTIESRLFDGKRREIKVGDEIEFGCEGKSGEKIVVKVVGLYRFKSFKELFSVFEVEKFGGESVKELLAEIRQFYSKEDEMKWGVLGIEIEK